MSDGFAAADHIDWVQSDRHHRVTEVHRWIRVKYDIPNNRTARRLTPD